MSGRRPLPRLRAPPGDIGAAAPATSSISVVVPATAGDPQPGEPFAGVSGASRGENAAMLTANREAAISVTAPARSLTAVKRSHRPVDAVSTGKGLSWPLSRRVLSLREFRQALPQAASSALERLVSVQCRRTNGEHGDRPSPVLDELGRRQFGHPLTLPNACVRYGQSWNLRRVPSTPG